MNQSSLYYAAIDLGSNSCRLLIMKEVDAELKIIDAFSRVVRLSEGLSKTGLICDEAWERTISVLNHCARKLSHYQNIQLRCVATEACRQATNAQAFLEDVRAQTGFEFSVISQEEEAALAVKGIGGLLDPSYPYALVFDVGGASTEVVLLKQNKHDKKAIEIVDWLSLPLGVVSIAETACPENATSYLRITASIRDALEKFGEPHNLNKLIHQGSVQLVGSSGTATTAAALHLGLRYYARNRVDGVVLSFNEVENVIKDLQMMSIDQRNRHPCIGPERSDLVLAGMAVFEGLASAWPVGSVTVADRGVRDGIVYQLYEDAVTQPLPSVA